MILRRRQASSTSVPPCETLRWMVRRRSRRRPRTAHLFAADEACAHGPGEARRQRAGRRDLLGVHDVAQIGGRQVLRARGAFAAAAAVCGAAVIAIAAPLDAIGQAERVPRHVRLGEFFPRRLGALQWRARQHMPLAHAVTAPERVEDVVKALPVRMGGTKQRAQRRPERIRPQCRRRGKHGERVAGFGQAHFEAVVAQGADETGEPADRGAERARTVVLRGSLRSHLRVTELVHYATLPRSRSVTSRVMRARSSWVLSRHIIVS